MEGCRKGSGPLLEKVCEVCPRHGYEPSDELLRTLWLYSLQRGGYPFQANDLSVEEWIRLGELREEIEAMKAGVKRGG